jgi:hypothetical protein
VRRSLWLLAFLATRPLVAQVTAPRSAAYLFSSNADDARALWVNPAGLGIFPLATIYAEMAADRGTIGVVPSDWGVRQFSFGLQSRGIGFSYQKDRYLNGGGDSHWRAGAGIPIARFMAIGFAATFTKPSRQYDAGIRVAPARVLGIGAVVHNIGRPDVAGTELPMVIVSGAQFHLAGGRLSLQGDVVATDRHPASGYDKVYRLGASLLIPRRQPVTLLTAVDLGGNGKVTRWNFGLGIGFQAQLLAVGSALPGNGMSAVSFAGVARGRTRH